MIDLLSEPDGISSGHKTSLLSLR